MIEKHFWGGPPVCKLFLVSGNMNMEKNKEKKVKKQRYFIEDWLSDDNFKDWLRKDRKDNTKARCILCNKSIELSSSGRSALTDHAKGAKHNEALKKVKIFFAEPKKTTSSQPLVSSESRECLIEKQKNWSPVLLNQRLQRQKLSG